MESNYEEEYEVDEREQENNNIGIGRLYECVFCKRGFNTAQALGGHMNIHTRDRARNKPNFNKQEKYFFGPRLSHQIPAASNYIVYDDDQDQPRVSFSTYFPASTSNTRPSYTSHFPDQQYCSNNFDRNQRHPDNLLFAEDSRMSLSSDYTPTVLEDLEKNREAIRSCQEEELDLELRLGYDSWNYLR